MNHRSRQILVFAALANAFIPIDAHAFTFTVEEGDTITVDVILPGGDCGDTYGVFVERDPLVGSTTSDNECFTDLEQPVASSEPPGANCTYGGTKFVLASSTTYACNGAPGTGASQTLWVDSTGLEIPEIHEHNFVNWGSTTPILGYWTGHAWWPFYIDSGMDPIEYSPFWGTVLTYTNNTCTSTPFVSRMFHSNDVFAAEMYLGEGGTPYYMEGEVETQASCWQRNTLNVCVSTGCPPEPWAAAYPEGDPPPVGEWVFPIFPTIVD